MRKLLGFFFLFCSLAVVTVGCKPKEEPGVDVEIGGGEGIHVEGENTDVQIGGGEGVQVEHEE